jgi:hypothetical protein
MNFSRASPADKLTYMRQAVLQQTATPLLLWSSLQLPLLPQLAPQQAATAAEIHSSMLKLDSGTAVKDDDDEAVDEEGSGRARKCSNASM